MTATGRGRTAECREARRTLACWLLAAFLGRDCDPTTARIPDALPRERTLSPREAAALRNGSTGNLRLHPGPKQRADKAPGTRSGHCGEGGARVLVFPA